MSGLRLCHCRPCHARAFPSIAVRLQRVQSWPRHLQARQGSSCHRGQTLLVQAANSRLSQRDSVKLRGEVESPFRSFRLVLYGFFSASAGLGSFLTLVPLIKAFRSTQGNGLPLDELQNLGIDVVAFVVFAFLFRNDWEARRKQLDRLEREERLGALQIELANNKVVRLSQLRAFARVVLVAGTQEQVQEAVDAAEPSKEALMERGVLVVPLPIFERSSSAVLSSMDEVPSDDLRWSAKPRQLEQWRGWFRDQASLAGASSETGLYVGLRLDGRVRASGRGQPPWAAFARQLPPLSGDSSWGGWRDGFDGPVRSFD